MSTITLVFTLVVAIEHLYIMYLETLATNSRQTSRIFGITPEQLSDKTTSTLLKNQGIYNGFLAILIVVAALTGNILWTRLLLSFVILVAIYGSVTSNPSIILKQGGIAIIALAASFLL